MQRKQLELSVDHIRQHKGQPQVDRGVKVQVPGKHFPGLQPAEQKVLYEGTAIEHAERHKFLQHHKAWVARTRALVSASCARLTRWTTPTTRASGQRWHYGTAGAMYFLSPRIVSKV